MLGENSPHTQWVCPARRVTLVRSASLRLNSWLAGALSQHRDFYKAQGVPVGTAQPNLIIKTLGFEDSALPNCWTWVNSLALREPKFSYPQAAGGQGTEGRVSCSLRQNCRPASVHLPAVPSAEIPVNTAVQRPQLPHMEWARVAREPSVRDGRGQPWGATTPQVTNVQSARATRAH